MITEPTYNGYINYETWAVARCLDNEEHTCDLLYGLANLRPGTIEHRSRELQATVEDMAPDLGATMWADLLDAALEQVNWWEIIEVHTDQQRLANQWAAEQAAAEHDHQAKKLWGS